MKEGVDIHLRS